MNWGSWAVEAVNLLLERFDKIIEQNDKIIELLERK